MWISYTDGRLQTLLKCFRFLSQEELKVMAMHSRIRFVDTLFIDNNLLMNKVFSLHLSACILEAKER